MDENEELIKKTCRQQRKYKSAAEYAEKRAMKR
jgi:hypothetical protein